MCNDREGNLLTDKTMVAARWREHFETLLNRENVSASTNRIRISDDEAIKELKNCKAAGKDELPVELFKHGSEQLHEILHRTLLKDDIDIIGIDRRAEEKAFVPFKRETARIGPTISIIKTKYMIAGRIRGSNSEVGVEVVLGGDKFEVVEEFVYLGPLVTCDNDVTREVKRRLAAANRAFYGLRSQLKSRSLQTKTKFALYKTLIVPVALYGHETWTLREIDRRAFGVFEQYSAVKKKMASGDLV
ncbi:uncharacterized protein LOC131695065 [Topomyia yanbarensis]|uniref:uncharacterized protein LOC131695065 n=1 Tax=Topomyia yanbarensis TaxID=2498891 RepID=UPI00273AB2AD|nr:uncharacterized protein LOC131695065 [Topomyia yanbarensis]